MHRFRLLASLVAVLFLAVSCGGKKNPLSGKDALDEDDVALLTYINVVQEDSLAAVEDAQRFAPAVSDKVQKMSDLIEAGNCTFIKQLPGDRYDQDWSGRVEVQGDSSCPVVSKRSWVYQHARGEWTMNEVYVNKNDEYKKLDAVLTKNLTGSMTVRRPPNRVSITGEFKYSNFQISEIGRIEATIATKQEYQRNSGGGEVTMEMTVNGERKYVVEIRLNQNMNATYKINNHNSEKKMVAELFSSFGLLEIVDRSGKMR